MKKEALITITGILIIGIGYFGIQMFEFVKGVIVDIEQNYNQNLILVVTDYEIDLKDLDSVRENLNGFWVLENNQYGKEILWLKFESNKKLTDWKTIPFTEEIKRTKILPYKSCSTIVNLIKVDDEVQMQFVFMNRQDTTKIEQLTKTKFKIDGITYLKHKGYDFLK